MTEQELADANKEIVELKHEIRGLKTEIGDLVKLVVNLRDNQRVMLGKLDRLQKALQELI